MAFDTLLNLISASRLLSVYYYPGFIEVRLDSSRQ